MYIEFTLPRAEGRGATFTAYKIHRLLHQWSERHNIAILSIKPAKYTIRVTLVDPQHYGFFALTWDPRSESSYINNFSLIEPMKDLDADSAV